MSGLLACLGQVVGVVERAEEDTPESALAFLDEHEGPVSVDGVQHPAGRDTHRQRAGHQAADGGAAEDVEGSIQAPRAAGPVAQLDHDLSGEEPPVAAAGQRKHLEGAVDFGDVERRHRNTQSPDLVLAGHGRRVRGRRCSRRGSAGPLCGRGLPPRR